MTAANAGELKVKYQVEGQEEKGMVLVPAKATVPETLRVIAEDAEVELESIWLGDARVKTGVFAKFFEPGATFMVRRKKQVVVACEGGTSGSAKPEGAPKPVSEPASGVKPWSGQVSVAKPASAPNAVPGIRPAAPQHPAEAGPRPASSVSGPASAMEPMSVTKPAVEAKPGPMARPAAPQPLASVAGEVTFNVGTRRAVPAMEGDWTAENTASLGEVWNLEKVRLPAGVTAVGAGAFKGAGNLTDVCLGVSNEKVGEEAFKECKALKRVEFGAKCEKIGNSAFSDCTSLANVTIPAGCTSIGAGAFEGCTSLANLTIPASCASIGAGAFEGCTSLANVTIPASCALGVGVFFNCPKVKITKV
jgi:hypothetical protein